MKKRNIFKPTMYLLLRLFLVGVLCFMTSPLSMRSEAVFNPIFAVFYYFVLMYFFVYTMWYEGCQDRIHLKSVTRPSAHMPYKGFLCSGILAAVQLVIYAMPSFFSHFGVRSLSVAGSVLRTACLIPYIYPLSLVSASNLSGGAMSQSQTDFIWTTAVYILLILSTVVGAGIGYLAGYRDVKILKPYIDKWHRE